MERSEMESRETAIHLATIEIFLTECIVLQQQVLCHCGTEDGEDADPRVFLNSMRFVAMDAARANSICEAANKATRIVGKYRNFMASVASEADANANANAGVVVPSSLETSSDISSFVDLVVDGMTSVVVARLSATSQQCKGGHCTECRGVSAASQNWTEWLLHDNSSKTLSQIFLTRCAQRFEECLNDSSDDNE